MDSIIDLTEKEIKEIEGGSWLTVALFFVNPALAVFNEMVEEEFG